MEKDKMKTLFEIGKDKTCVVAAVKGDTRFISRITSIGITPGCKVTIVKNEKSRPIIIYSRDTMIALNRNECKNIMVNETGDAA